VPDEIATDKARYNPFPDDRPKMSGVRARTTVKKRGRIVYPQAMMPGNEDDPDRRVRRTRAAVVDAFIRLIFARRYDSIRTADLIAEADIGRSTFYEHFRSKDDVLAAVINPLFVPLANAATGRAGVVPVRMMLDHLWEQRALARVIFDPDRLPRLQRKLAAMIGERLDRIMPDTASRTLIATAAAAAQLAMLRLWLAGEVACPAAELALLLVNDLPVKMPGREPLDVAV
jgi:AcrR family transcriptional regulator